MPATPNLALPYPNLGDSPNGPAQIGALAAALDNASSHAAMFALGSLDQRPDIADVPNGFLFFATNSDLLVLFVAQGGAWSPLNDPRGPFNTLPVAPKLWDGMRIKYNADAAKGVIWELEYQQGASGTFKWRCIGGGWLAEEIDTGEAQSSTSYGNLTTVGPSVTPPLAGDYQVKLGSRMQITPSFAPGEQGFMSFQQAGGPSASDDDAVTLGVANPGPQVTGSPYRERLKTFTAGGAVIAKYRAIQGTSAPVFSQRMLGIRPIRVI